MKGCFGFRPSPGVDFPTPLDAIEADFASVLLFSSLVRAFVPGLERPTVQIGRRDDEFRVIEIRIFGDEGRKPTRGQGTWGWAPRRAWLLFSRRLLARRCAGCPSESRGAGAAACDGPAHALWCETLLVISR